MSITNLANMFAKADRFDRDEGELAYYRYHQLMVRIANHYNLALEKVTAAFVALSPNNDYEGNLRSLITLIEGVMQNVPLDNIVCTTYGHCLIRSHAYLTGCHDFSTHCNGLKTRNFYENILNPNDNRFVTIDGHITAIWRGDDDNAIMKDSKPSTKEYDQIQFAINKLAFSHFLLPQQMQAILWFTRKRVLSIRFNPQLDMFINLDGDSQRTSRPLEDIKPFPFKLQNGG